MRLHEQIDDAVEQLQYLIPQRAIPVKDRSKINDQILYLEELKRRIEDQDIELDHG